MTKSNLQKKTTEKKITIIQGTKDSTVDWEHNLKFLKQRITNTDVIMIDGAGHQLMNETPRIRTTVLKKVLEKVQANIENSTEQR